VVHFTFVNSGTHLIVINYPPSLILLKDRR